MQNIPKTTLIKRHYVDNPDKLIGLELGIEHLNESIDLSETKNLGIKFGINLTTDGSQEELAQSAVRALAAVSHNAILSYSSQNEGSGTSFRKILFNSNELKKNDIIAVSCLDQYITNTEKSLEMISELAKSMKKDNALYANGSRDIPVLLATNERNSNLRIIHELYHSLAAGSENYFAGEFRDNVTPAYALVGESSSGFYMINPRHSGYNELKKSVVNDIFHTGMDGFAVEYYTAIKAPQLGKIATGYVSAKENKFYEEIDEQQEFEKVKNLIQSQTKMLRSVSTSVSFPLYDALQCKEFQNILCDLFPDHDVEFVRETMIKAFEPRSLFC